MDANWEDGVNPSNQLHKGIDCLCSRHEQAERNNSTWYVRLYICFDVEISFWHVHRNPSHDRLWKYVLVLWLFKQLGQIRRITKVHFDRPLFFCTGIGHAMCSLPWILRTSLFQSSYEQIYLKSWRKQTNDSKFLFLYYHCCYILAFIQQRKKAFAHYDDIFHDYDLWCPSRSSYLLKFLHDAVRYRTRKS